MSCPLGTVGPIYAWTTRTHARLRTPGLAIWCCIFLSWFFARVSDGRKGHPFVWSVISFDRRVSWVSKRVKEGGRSLSYSNTKSPPNIVSNVVFQDTRKTRFDWYCRKSGNLTPCVCMSVYVRGVPCTNLDRFLYTSMAFNRKLLKARRTGHTVNDSCDFRRIGKACVHFRHQKRVRL